jgi:tetratricopeptide (TPR) repeat protein
VPTRLERDDPYLGFAGAAPLYVEERAADGTSLRVTAPAKRRFFNLQRFADPKPPGTKRAFCLGGSTTYGHPYDDATSFCAWLRALLPYADPGARWEVINAGGISYASYRIARLARELAGYEPDLLIVYTWHNEFLEARTYTSAWLRDPRLARLGSALAATRVFSLVSLAAEGLSSRPLLAQEVDALLDSPTGLDAYRRDDALREAVVAHFRDSLARIVATGRGAGAKVVLVAPASNLADFAPFKSEGPHQRDAAALYAQARAWLAQGRAAEADAAVVRARDEDVCPLRAISPLVAAVREVAAAQRTPLVDFELLLAERMRLEHEHASPGAEYFLDHVHPTVAANRLLALALLDALRSAGVVERAPAESEVDVVTRGVESSLDERAQGRALRRLAKVLSWAGKDEEAARLAAQAEAKLGGDAESRFILGSHALAPARYDEAASLLARAVELDPRTRARA